MLPPRFEKHTAVSYKQRNMVMQGTFFSSHKRLRTIVLAAKILIFPFTKGTSAITIDLQKDNKPYLVKMGEGGGLTTSNFWIIGKQTWKYLLVNHIMITVEYLPSKLNMKEDWDSRLGESNSEWKHLDDTDKFCPTNNRSCCTQTSTQKLCIHFCIKDYN